MKFILQYIKTITYGNCLLLLVTCGSLIVGCDSNYGSKEDDRMIVNINQYENDTTSGIMVIEMDSFNRYLVGTNVHWSIEIKIKVSDDTLFYMLNEKWEPVVSLGKYLDEGFIKYKNEQDSFKITVLGEYPPRNTYKNEMYFFSIRNIGYRDFSLLVAINDKLKVKAVGFGAWPAEDKFDCLFYQGELDVLTRAAYIKNIERK